MFKNIHSMSMYKFYSKQILYNIDKVKSSLLVVLKRYNSCGLDYTKLAEREVRAIKPGKIRAEHLSQVMFRTSSF